jgi:hypothetical protein
LNLKLSQNGQSESRIFLQPTQFHSRCTSSKFFVVYFTTLSVLVLSRV